MNAISPIVASNAGLSARALLASLSVCKWSATRLDKKATREVTASNGAAPDAGRFNKRLVSKEALKAIAEIESRARTAHYDMTLPWSDDGPRILAARGLAGYNAAMRALQAEFSAAVDSFVAGYPQFRADAQAELGSLFNPGDYPDAATVGARFRFDFKLAKVPEGDDFRVQIDSAQLADIRASIDREAREAFAGATRDAWRRIAEAVGHMATKLREYQPGGDGKRASGTFHASLVDNVRKLVDLLPSLNIADDPALDSIAKRMAADLCADDAKALRESDTARESVAAAAESILADVSAYLQ